MKKRLKSKQQGFAILFVCIMILIFMSVIAVSGMRATLFDSSMHADLQDVQLGADNCADSVAHFVSDEIQRNESYGLASSVKPLTESSDNKVADIAGNSTPAANACVAGFWNLVQANHGFQGVANPTDVFGFAKASVGGVGSNSDFQLSYLAVKLPVNCNPNTAISAPNNPILNYKFYWVVGRCVVPYVSTKDQEIAKITPAYTANKFTLVIVTN